MSTFGGSMITFHQSMITRLYFAQNFRRNFLFVNNLD